MKLTVYKTEAGLIDKVVLVAEGEEDAKRLLDFNEQFNSGSGTGRWGDHGNWTFGSDGTGYHPDSYGTGKPLEPFVPFVAPDPLVVGSSFRILKGDGSVDPVVHVATAVSDDLITYESDGETLEVRREHTVQVIPPAV